MTAPLPTAAAPATDQTSARAHVRAVATASGSSFLWGMRLLPRPRREAMYAIYAFCREVDDIADEAGSVERKLAALDACARRSSGSTRVARAGRPPALCSTASPPSTCPRRNSWP